MRILLACECSNTISKEFRKLGHYVLSCDLQANDEDQTNHYQGSVFDVLNDGWDMMIGHPPCTYISYAGTQSWNDKGRVFKRLEALEFFAKLWEADIPMICLENPKSCASPVIAKYSQEIQPYYFGESQQKTTWLWLKGLPPLKWTPQGGNLFETETSCGKPEPMIINGSGKAIYFTEGNSGSKTRSKAFEGIAKAMAEQWGSLSVSSFLGEEKNENKNCR